MKKGPGQWPGASLLSGPVEASRTTSPPGGGSPREWRTRGRPATTPCLLSGGSTVRGRRRWTQGVDPESGLHYNRHRHRHYDPESGRYVSPDPLRLVGAQFNTSHEDNYPGQGDGTAREMSEVAYARDGDDGAYKVISVPKPDS
ncbi:RHS repeat-associated core domain-containing protein [Streptomyces pratensis]|uniref:RHS repeat-associated core domain-containing protein n=1 Tax=Streptomyces pratensis TaxID=1169025 RepID=UPI00362B6401